VSFAVLLQARAVHDARTSEYELGWLGHLFSSWITCRIITPGTSGHMSLQGSDDEPLQYEIFHVSGTRTDIP